MARPQVSKRETCGRPGGTVGRPCPNSVNSHGSDSGGEHMDDWVLRMPLPQDEAKRADLLLNQEWLVTNALGGYASGTIAGVASRRYHSLLIAALPAPLGRYVMLNHLSEKIRLPGGEVVEFGGEERVGGALVIHSVNCLTEFRLDVGLPVWHYEAGGVVWEKRILLPH